jgi:hypothetical protein
MRVRLASCGPLPKTKRRLPTSIYYPWKTPQGAFLVRSPDPTATIQIMRPEVRAYIRLSAKLLELSLAEHALTRAECDAIAFYAQDLDRHFGPSHQQLDAPTDPLLAQFHLAAFSTDWEMS